MRVLITGAAGFVAPYAARALRRLGVGVEVVGATREAAVLPDFGATVGLDVTDPRGVRAAIEAIRPTHVLHLAGVAAPQTASADPVTAWQINTLGTLALGRALLSLSPDTIMLNAGSASAYGESANRVERLNEESSLAPIDEYGATKAAADLGLGALAKRGLRVVRLRPFNHVGAGQSVDYAIPAFAAQIAAIEKGKREPVVEVGNLEAERDFCDVADIAEAYAIVAASGGLMEPGQVYNLCSGQAVSVRSVLELLLSMSTTRIEVRQDPKRMRPSEIPRLVGDTTRAEDELKWRASTPLEETVRAVLASFRQ